MLRVVVPVLCVLFFGLFPCSCLRLPDINVWWYVYMGYLQSLNQMSRLSLDFSHGLLALASSCSRYSSGGLFGCSYAPCLTIHWSRSAFESVMVSLLEFSVILGYRVKAFVAECVFSCS